MTSSPKTIGLIPARLESSRLPRKALADICGIPMVVHVVLRCQKAQLLDEVYVATDSSEIAEVVQRYGGKVILTSSAHQTGSDRIAEAATQLDCDIVVNIQGDEALVDPEHIDRVTQALHQNPELQVAILVTPFQKYNSPGDIKVVTNEKGEILYFSRTDIPSSARTPNPPMLKAYHVIPFRKSFLLQYAQWEPTALERIEYNEYLRILEKGYAIQTIPVDSAAISVDTPEDLEWVRQTMEADPLFLEYQHIT